LLLKPLILLKKTAPTLIGFGLIYLSFLNITEVEKQTIWNNILSANLFWVLVSLIIGILSHVSRAYRWIFLLKPLNYTPKLAVSFRAVMIGYFINLGLPRSGEVARAMTLSRYKNAPSFQKIFGTIITERIIDLILLFIVVGITCLSNTNIFLTYFKDFNVSWLQWSIAACGIIFVYLTGSYLLKFSKNSWILKIKNFFREVISAMLSIFKIESGLYFIAHTLFIWISYIAMFAIITYSLNPVPDIPWPAIALGFIAGSFAMSASSGGIGAFPIAIAAAFALYDIETTIGLAFGWIMWTSQTLMNIIIGGSALLYESLIKKQKNDKF